jgi:hypothetical protein
MITAMPGVRDCEALDCNYNTAWKCHAPVVSVGKQVKPACNTYRASDLHECDGKIQAAVGECRMHMCLRNRDMMCNAYAIKVRISDGQPHCVSFKNRYK